MYKALLKDLFEYNIWANKRLIEMIPVHLAEQEINSSFKSIAKTVYHLWDAQHIWLRRMEGESLDGWPSRKYDGTFADAATAYIKQCETLSEFVNSKPEEFFTSDLVYKDLKGNEFKQPNFEVLMQLYGHGCFHRGQIITLLRQLGQTDLLQTDYIRYCRERD